MPTYKAVLKRHRLADLILPIFTEKKWKQHTEGRWEMPTVFQFQSFPCSGAYVNGQNTRKKCTYILK